MKSARKILAMLLSLSLLLSVALPASVSAAYEDAHTIVLDSVQNTDGSYTHTALYDGVAVNEYDYTWHADPSTVHTEVSNSPAEYYTGTEPGNDAVYIAHDIYYYPELPTSGFVKQSYDGEQEWCYYYTAEGYTGYIFSTLPGRSSLPTEMMHSEADAYQNAVLHITQPGDYVIEGTWHGQIWVDLANYCDDPFTDPTAKVNLILNGVTIDCSVAAGVVFYNVYECDNTWEDQTSWTYNVDTSAAGAVVTLADGTVNNVSGTNIFRILKTQYKSGSTSVQKKRLKIDGSFYSYQSMTIQGGSKGTGVLNLTAGYEGMNSELHLTINGGNVNIFSQDDGINVNEDNVSVLTVNGGTLHILAGLGSEGDGIDSNGFISVNGGTIITMANPGADSGMDSDFGTYVFGGNVVALGATMDWASNDSSVVYDQANMNLQFSSSRSAGDSIVITDTAGNGIFAYDPDKDEINGSQVRTYTGAIVSCEAMKKGESYYVYIGGEVTGDDTMGVYDMTTVTAVTGTYQQSYGSTGISGPGGRPGSSSSSSSGSGSTTFTLSSNVNKFSGVSNYSSSTNITVTPAEGGQPEEKTYYLFGYINGANYACEEDYENMGAYQFVGGKLSAVFTQDSYVAVKEADNAAWYMTQSYCTDTTCTLYNTSTGAAEKMFVPGNVEVKFTLTENEDDTLTLSYETVEPECAHTYNSTIVSAATCTDYAVYALTCSACGDTQTLCADEMTAQWLYAVPTGMSASDFENAQMYRYRDYAQGGWTETGSGTVTYVSSWPTGFDTANSLYSQYNNAKATAYNTGTEKLVIDSNQISGYLYYHWCYEGYPYTVATQSGSYNRFHAYYSTKAPSEANKNDPSDNSYRFDDATACDDSCWYFYVPVYTQSYTTSVFTDAGWGPWSDWSSTGVTASETRLVESAQLYRYTAAALGSHSYSTSVTAATCEIAGQRIYSCTNCGDSYTETIPATGHSYADGTCTVCGAIDPDSVVTEKTYYLFGYINGANYACEEDYQNMGQYQFVNGKLTVTFTQDSYVAVKEADNAAWYMTSGWQGTEVTSVTLYNTNTGITADKLYVPGNVELTFTLTENADGTLTLSYTTASTPSTAPTLTLKYPTLTFEDVITMNVFFAAENLEDVVEMGLITYKSEVTEWNVSNAEAVVPGYIWNETEQLYAASTEGIAAKEMGDTYWFAVYAKLSDGTYTYTRLVSYSPTTYAYNQLSDASMSKLVVAMLNYGAAAQTYFNYRTDSLMNANLTADQLASVEAYRADMMDSISTVTDAKAANFTRTSTGFTQRYPTITFEGAFSIDYFCQPSFTPVGDITLYYWDQAAFDACTVLTTDNATGALTLEKSGDLYGTSVEGIAAKDLDKGVYVAFVYSDGTNTYCSGILGYSIGLYCQGLASGTDAMAPFAAATAVYGYYAKQMFY